VCIVYFFHFDTHMFPHEFKVIRPTYTPLETHPTWRIAMQLMSSRTGWTRRGEWDKCTQNAHVRLLPSNLITNHKPRSIGSHAVIGSVTLTQHAHMRIGCQVSQHSGDKLEIWHANRNVKIWLINDCHVAQTVCFRLFGPHVHTSVA
jgi:hypothetical protein